VINVDDNPSYPKVVAELKGSRNWGGGAEVEPVPTWITSLNRTTRAIKSPRQCEPRVSFARWSVAGDSRLRGHAYHSKTPSEVVTERGCGRADSLDPWDPRIEGCL